MDRTHAISWAYRLLLWSADSFHGLLPETLFIFVVSCRRLFSFIVRWTSLGHMPSHGLTGSFFYSPWTLIWSADSFIVHSMDSPLLTSSSTASMHFLDLLSSTSLVDHFHCRPRCWLPALLDFHCSWPCCQRPASAGLTLSTLLLTASVRWT